MFILAWAIAEIMIANHVVIPHLIEVFLAVFALLETLFYIACLIFIFAISLVDHRR